MKNLIPVYSILFLVIIIFANILGNLITQNKCLDLQLQSQIEKVSDYENEADMLREKLSKKDLNN